MFLVGVTAIGFAHGKALNAGEIRVPTKWFPGYALNASSAERPEVKAVWTSPDGVTYLGTRIGLFRSLRGGDPEAVRGLNNVDVKGLVSTGEHGGVFAATRDGVFRVDADAAQLVLAGDAHAVAVQGTTLLVTHRKRGVLQSDDAGSTWRSIASIGDAAARIPLPPVAETVTLSRLIFDIHTGSAFIGATYDWIWWDVLGAILAFLVATGVYLWWVARRRLARERTASLPTGAVPTPAPVRPPSVVPVFASLSSADVGPR
jgi:hypothetical protein